MIAKSTLSGLLGFADTANRGIGLSTYKQHAAAINTYSINRVATCSRFPSTSGLHLIRRGAGAALVGFARCKSHQICPICHAIWLRDQYQKLTRILNGWMGATSTLTLTFSHRYHDSLADGLRTLNHIRRKFMASRVLSAPWIAGSVLRIEVSLTVGGWHPHLHGLILSGREPSPEQLNAISQAWNAATVEVTGRKSKIAAHSEIMPDKSAALRAGAYVFKRDSQSPFALLSLINQGTSLAPVAIVDAAKALWRNYCRSIVDTKGLRYVTVSGCVVKNSWATYGNNKAERKANAVQRIYDSMDERLDVEGFRSPSTALHEQVLADYKKSRYDEETLRYIAELENALVEAMELRDELGYDGVTDPCFGEVERILDRLGSAYSNVKSDSTGQLPGLVTISALGAKLLTPDHKAALSSVSTHAEARAILDKIIKEYPGKENLEPYDLYSLNYDNQKIVSMYLPSFEPPK
jgi:hypothetical protein